MNASPEPASETDAEPTRPGGKPWPIVLINFWLDAVLFVAVFFLVWTAVILKFAFPPPTAAAGWSLWGLSFDQWHNLQFGALCVSAALTVEHLVLHWNWVCTVLATRVLRRGRPDEGNQAAFGIATFIGAALLVKISVIVAMISIKSP